MMRRVLMCGVLLLAACGDDPVRIFGDLQWQVRCELARGCTASPARSIMHLDGEMGHDVSCEAVRTTSGDYSLSFDARMGDAYGISVRNATFPATGGGLLGAGCTISVIDDSTTYQGSCGANFPTDTQHCRISDLTIADEREGRTLVGRLLCINLPSRSDRARVREVTMPATAFDANDPNSAMPSVFRFVGCTGL